MKYSIPMTIEVDFGEGISLDDPQTSLSKISEEVVGFLNEEDQRTLIEEYLSESDDTGTTWRPYHVRVSWPQADLSREAKEAAS